MPAHFQAVIFQEMWQAWDADLGQPGGKSSMWLAK